MTCDLRAISRDPPLSYVGFPKPLELSQHIGHGIANLCKACPLVAIILYKESFLYGFSEHTLGRSLGCQNNRRVDRGRLTH
jgi:hypothetical protein